jgi:hypothetical protein
MRILAGNPHPDRTTPAPDRLTLVNGRPETIALAYPAGKPVSSRYGGGQQMMYTLTDGRRAFFDLAVAREIDALRLGPGQPFTICKLGPNAWDISPAAPAPRQQPRQQPQPPQEPPIPWPEEVSHAPAPKTAPATRVNGAGEDLPAIMARNYRSAIQIALDAAEFARSQGLMITPSFEDIRCISTALFIQDAGGRR